MSVTKDVEARVERSGHDRCVLSGYLPEGAENTDEKP